MLTVLTVVTVFSALVLNPDHPGSSRPSGLKATSIPRTRRNVCARRKRPRDRAGVLGPTSGSARGGGELECGFTFRREPAELCISTFMTRPNFASIRRRSSHRGNSLCTTIRWRYSSCLGRDGIKPAQPAKPRKITIGGAQRKPVFHGQRSQMSVWYKIAIYAGQREKLT